ncbi:MAG: TolC family protein [Sedimentisphaeraceae bacterium JB056]
MKTKILLLIILFVAGVSYPQQNRNIPVGNLTCSQARELALENNPGIEQALEGIVAAEQLLRGAKSSLLPVVSANATASLYDGVEQLDWNPSVRAHDSFKQNSAGIQINWLLFDGFAREARILGAKYGVERNEELLKDTQRLLVQAVSTAFYQAQLSVEQMVIADENMTFNKRLEDDSRKRWQVGVAPESEMLNFTVKAIEAKADYVDSQRGFEVAATVLARLMALPDAKLQADMYPVRTDSKISKPTENIDTQIALAVANRPDLKALNASVMEARQLVRQNKAAYSPALSVFGGFEYLDQDDIAAVDQDEHRSYIGIAARWNLYTGSRRYADVKNAEALVRQLKAQKNNKILEIQSSIRGIMANAASSYQIYLLYKETFELTSKIRDNVEKSYKAGTESLTRLNESQRDLVRASGAVASSLIRYRLDLLELMTETGQILYK